MTTLKLSDKEVHMIWKGEGNALSNLACVLKCRRAMTDSSFTYQHVKIWYGHADITSRSIYELNCEDL